MGVRGADCDMRDAASSWWHRAVPSGIIAWNLRPVDCVGQGRGCRDGQSLTRSPRVRRPLPLFCAYPMKFIELSGKSLRTLLKGDELSPEELDSAGVADDTIVRINQQGDIEVSPPGSLGRDRRPLGRLQAALEASHAPGLGVTIAVLRSVTRHFARHFSQRVALVTSAARQMDRRRC